MTDAIFSITADVSHSRPLSYSLHLFIFITPYIMEHIILYAIVPIIVVMLAGYISGKKGIFTGDDSKNSTR